MTAMTLLPQTELTRTKQQILSTVPPLRAEVQLIQVETEDDYHRASVLLTRIQTSKRLWRKGDPSPDGKWKGIDAIIKPFKEGLDGLYTLRNDGDQPHDEMEEVIKEKMRLFKIAENKRIAEKQAARDAKEQQLQQEIADKQARVYAAKTPKMREKLIGQQMALEDQHKAVTKTKIVPVKAVGSAARTVKFPAVVDFMALVSGIVALYAVGDTEGIPTDLLMVNPVRLAQMWKDSPDLVAQLPGVEIQEDVIIAGR